ncbi:MAG: hypothetical protein K0Q72_4882 [Armatimonadetes bacterium]|jgi:hypothetical protein|nr:hypothetical protein [Armatimonadota bacterium]
MNLLNDPMAAGFIWRTILVIFSWTMFLQLRKQGSQFWWIKMLKSARLVSMENYNYAGMVEKSRLFFQWLAIAATCIFLWHSLQFYRRYDPDFLWGPKPVTFTSPEGRPGLPPAIPGAGGGGATTVPGAGLTGRPGSRPGEQVPGQSVPGQGMPGQPGQPGMPGGGPGGLPPPGTGGSRGMPGTQ